MERGGRQGDRGEKIRIFNFYDRAMTRFQNIML